MRFSKTTVHINISRTTVLKPRIIYLSKGAIRLFISINYILTNNVLYQTLFYIYTIDIRYHRV